jgi:hypothetical protein
VLTWLRNKLPRLGSLALVVCILTAGLIAVLLVQPAPPSYAEGWSAPRSVDEVKSGPPHSAAIDRDDRIHLAWHKVVDRQPAAFYGRLDQGGQLVGGPVLLSTPGRKAENVSLLLADGDVPLCFWLEKGHEGGEQRLVMAYPDSGERQNLSVSQEIMRDLVVTTGQLANGERRILVAWSASQQGVYDIYLVELDGSGNPLASERRITDSGRTFVYQPTLALDDGVLHLVHFAEDALKQELQYQLFDVVTGEPLVEPMVLELMSQRQVDLTGSSRRESYPILAVSQAGGGARLYESSGSSVRHRQFDRNGRLVLSPEQVLVGGGRYSAVSHARRGNQQWLVWADTSDGEGERLQVRIAPLDELGRVHESERVTYLTTSALSPVMVVNSTGGRHIIWQQNVRPYAYELMYVNDLEPVPQTAWQRLGFAGAAGAYGFGFVLGESIVLGAVTSFVRIWRLAIGLAGVVAIRLLARRVDAVKPYAHLASFVMLLVLLVGIMKPEAQTLGQAPIAVANAAHWTMVAVASTLLFFLGWTWRKAMVEVWIWVALGEIWLIVYYALNTVLILREGFAV